MFSKLPKFIYSKNNIFLFLTFVAFFSLIFILIFKPFGADKWNILTHDEFILYTIIVVLIGFFILSISRIIMYNVGKKTDFTYANYFIWILCEVACVSVACTLFIWTLDKTVDKNFFNIFPKNFVYTFFILFIPYIISWLYLALKDKEKLVNATATIEDNSPSINKNELINFTDDKGNLKLSIKFENLIYIEAADNYIDIHYDNNKEKQAHFVMRGSLKTILEQTSNPNLIRCHRSYIVNFNKIKVLRKEKHGLFIELEAKNVPDIPISETYAEDVLKYFRTSLTNN